MSDIKVYDMVVCLPGFDNDPYGDCYGGIGWQLLKVFQVVDIDYKKFEVSPPNLLGNAVKKNAVMRIDQDFKEGDRVMVIPGFDRFFAANQGEVSFGGPGYEPSKIFIISNIEDDVAYDDASRGGIKTRALMKASQVKELQNILAKTPYCHPMDAAKLAFDKSTIKAASAMDALAALDDDRSLHSMTTSDDPEETPEIIVATPSTKFEHETLKGRLKLDITESDLQEMFEHNIDKFIETIGIEAILEEIGPDTIFDYFA